MLNKYRFLPLPVDVAYGGISFLISSLNNIFILFYMSTYLYVFKIDSTSFYIGETLFMVWNAVNDPMFGWISDNDSLHNDNRKCYSVDEIVKKRIKALSTFGPLFAVSFLLIWFQIFPVGIQFSIVLCLYDCFLTIVDLHHQALLADLVVNSKERCKLNSYCSTFNAAGTISVFLSFMLWNKKDLFHFQLFCTGMAIMVFIGFFICCHSIGQYYNKKGVVTSVVPHNSKDSIVAMKKYLRQICHHRNFLLFSLMNLVQVFHCHFNSNFFPLVIHKLLGKVLSSQAGAILLGISFLVPHLNNLYFLQLCSKYGTYFVIKVLFYIKLSLGVSMWVIGAGYWYVLCIFVASNRVFTEGICKLLNLVLTDIVDEDYVKFRRKSPVAALIIGTSAFLSKPGQTFAPLLGSYLMCVNTGQSMFLGDDESGNENLLEQGPSTNVDSDSVKEGCFNVLVSIPIWCAIVQIVAWNLFSLHGKHLSKIKGERYNEITSRDCQRV